MPIQKDINNVVDEEEYETELPFLEEEEEMYRLDEEPPEIHLTQDEYEKSKDTPLDFEHKKFGVSATQYQDISDALLTEVQRKYHLKSRTRKIPETSTTSTKNVPAKTTIAKQPVTPTHEPERPQPSFNLEQEISKIKIPVPLSELARNPTYKLQIQKWITNSVSNRHHDPLN